MSCKSHRKTNVNLLHSKSSPSNRVSVQVRSPVLIKQKDLRRFAVSPFLVGIARPCNNGVTELQGNDPAMAGQS